ncbi:MAG TPA: cytochrome C oxidase subunit IV family protein [Anaerolineales bacterium]|nr:cytochrome C oxidase subunit IV family protein [Anaerolineales bacterium]
MEGQNDVKMEEKKKEAFRVGFGVLILLAVLTMGEFWLGSVASAWWAPLILIAIMKAFLVVRDYMHLPRLLAGEEAHE